MSAMGNGLVVGAGAARSCLKLPRPRGGTQEEMRDYSFVVGISMYEIPPWELCTELGKRKQRDHSFAF